MVYITIIRKEENVMRNKVNKNLRLVLCIFVCTMFIAVSFFIATGTSINTYSNNTIKENNSTPLKSLAVFKLFNWNFWSNPPHIFTRNLGNVGIGTNNPLAKLDVFGNIAIKGKVIINESGNWVGNLSGMQGLPGPQGPQGIPGDSRWRLNGMNIYYTNGSVGIGTTQPTAKLDVQGGNITVDGFPVCIFIGYAQQTTNITVSSTWADITGASLNFTLPNAKYVDCRAFGSVPRPNFAIGFRFVIDNISYGNQQFGEMSSSGAGAWDPWYMERIVPLASGSHNIKIQIRGESYEFLYYNENYFAARLFVQAW